MGHSLREQELSGLGRGKAVASERLPYLRRSTSIPQYAPSEPDFLRCDQTRLFVIQSFELVHWQRIEKSKSHEVNNILPSPMRLAPLDIQLHVWIEETGHLHNITRLCIQKVVF
jgi:hypothetical protein